VLGLLPLLGSMCGVAHAGHWTASPTQPALIEQSLAAINFGGPTFNFLNQYPSAVTATYSWSWTPDFVGDNAATHLINSSFANDATNVSVDKGTGTSAGISVRTFASQSSGVDYNEYENKLSRNTDVMSPNPGTLPGGTHISSAIVPANATTASADVLVKVESSAGHAPGGSVSRDALKQKLNSISIVPAFP
jgi:hypothetical protein